MTRKHLQACALVLLLSASAAADARVYKWVDANGVTQYSETPPKGQTASEVQPPAAPGGGTRPATALDQMQQADQMLAERKRKQAAEERARAEAEQAAAAKRARCAMARSALAQLQFPGPIYTLDADGNKTYVDDNERDAQIERASKAVNEQCH